MVQILKIFCRTLSENNFAVYLVEVTKHCGSKNYKGISYFFLEND